MATSKVSIKDLELPVVEVLEVVEEVAATHNIKSYNSLAQIGVKPGTETIEDIMGKLPAYSIMQLAITSANNTEIYPMEVGTLIIEDAYNTGATFRFYSKDDNNIVRIWKGFYANGTWTGWKEVFTEETLTVEKLKEKGIAAEVTVSTTVTSGTKIGTININGTDYDLFAPESGDLSTITNLQEALDDIVANAPENMNTFDEVADAIEDIEKVVEEIDDAADALDLLIELGAIAPLTNKAGTIITDTNGNIFVI